MERSWCGGGSLSMSSRRDRDRDRERDRKRGRDGDDDGDYRSKRSRRYDGPRCMLGTVNLCISIELIFDGSMDG